MGVVPLSFGCGSQGEELEVGGPHFALREHSMAAFLAGGGFVGPLLESICPFHFWS